jgi:ferritin
VNDAVVKALNDQIRKELHSAYIYLAMAAHFEAEAFEGFAHWMKLQAQEEVAHAMKLYTWVLRRGERVVLQAIDAPPSTWGTPLSVFQAALDHEKKVTASIHALFHLAAEHKDVATQRELDWFVTEQVEEEENAGRAVELLSKAGDSDAALLMLDRVFGERTGEDQE